MKKLNRKGFTLVELLAVIIILAIVVGITIPAITNIISDSKNNALGVAVDSAADYLTDQYGYMNIDRGTATDEFLKAFGDGQTSAEYGTGITASTTTGVISTTLLKEMGFDANNVSKLTATLVDGTTICVTVTEIQKASEYYSTDFWSAAASATNTATPKLDASNKSLAKNSNC